MLSVLVLVVGAGVRRIAGGSERLPKASAAVTNLNRRMDAPSSTPLQTFVAPGFGARFESAFSTKSGDKQTVTATIVNRGAEKLEILEVLLLDFTPQATVSRMEVRTWPLSLKTDANQVIAFDSAMPRNPADSRVLAVSSLTSETKKHDTDVKILANALAKSRGQPAGIGVAEKARPQAGSSSSACFDWFQLVNDIASDNNSTMAAASNDYVRVGRLWSQLRWNLKVLGDRVEKPGKERLTMVGSLSRANEALPVSVLLLT